MQCSAPPIRDRIGIREAPRPNSRADGGFPRHRQRIRTRRRPFPGETIAATGPGVPSRPPSGAPRAGKGDFTGGEAPPKIAATPRIPGACRTTATGDFAFRSQLKPSF